MKVTIEHLDVLGNAEDGFEVNDITSKDTVQLPIIASDPDAYILRQLIDNGHLKDGKGWEKAYYVEDLSHGDGFAITICLASGEPLFNVYGE